MQWAIWWMHWKPEAWLTTPSWSFRLTMGELVLNRQICSDRPVRSPITGRFGEPKVPSTYRLYFLRLLKKLKSNVLFKLPNLAWSKMALLLKEDWGCKLEPFRQRFSSDYVRIFQLCFSLWSFFRDLTINLFRIQWTISNKQTNEACDLGQFLPTFFIKPWMFH